MLALQSAVSAVAGAIDVAGPGQRQVFNVRPKRKVYRALDSVAPVVEPFRNDVPRVVHDVSVISLPAKHPVGSTSTIRSVVALIASEAIVTAIAQEGIPSIATSEKERRGHSELHPPVRTISPG